MILIARQSKFVKDVIRFSKMFTLSSLLKIIIAVNISNGVEKSIGRSGSVSFSSV